MCTWPSGARLVQGAAMAGRPHCGPGMRRTKWSDAGGAAMAIPCMPEGPGWRWPPVCAKLCAWACASRRGALWAGLWVGLGRHLCEMGLISRAGCRWPGRATQEKKEAGIE